MEEEEEKNDLMLQELGVGWKGACYWHLLPMTHPSGSKCVVITCVLLLPVGCCLCGGGWEGVYLWVLGNMLL